MGPAGGSRSAAWLGAAALLAATLVAYQPATEAGFVWDDDANVTDNQPLRSPAGLAALWLEPGATTQYYPLVYTSLWVEYQLWGLAPFGYHLTNILLHAACAVLLWRLLLLLGLPGAWLAAAVFALHPVHVESVAWVTERKNVLSGLFYLAAAWVYLARVSDAFAGPDARDERRRRRDHALALALFVAALLCKSPVASLPAALALVIWWKKGRLGRADWRPLVPFALAAVPIGLLTVSLESRVGVGLGFAWDPSPVERVLQAGRAVFFYAGKLLWPVDLAFVYPRWDVDDRVAWQYLYPLAGVLLVAVLFAARRRIGRGPVTAVLYFGGTLVPVLGFVEIYFFRFSLVADHWQYLASIGPTALLICGSAARLRARGIATDGPPARAGSAALLLVLGALTWQQSHAYRDSITLWRDSLAVNPASGMVHYNLANDLRAAGRVEEALPHYREAIALGVSDPGPLNNLALLLAERGHEDESLALLREAVSRHPGDVASRWNLASAAERRGDLDEALLHFEHALAQPRPADVSPATWVDLHVSLCEVLARHARLADAARRCGRALSLDPDHTAAHLQLGEVELRRGRYAAAIRHFDAVLVRHPGESRVRRLRGHAQQRLAEAARAGDAASQSSD